MAGAYRHPLAIEDGADIIIGPLFGPAVSAAGQVARQAGIPIIAFTTDTTVAGDDPYCCPGHWGTVTYDWDGRAFVVGTASEVPGTLPAGRGPPGDGRCSVGWR